ncbi:MAG: 50S ribosomal protein L4 [Verrucomicrobia bacterium]|jgi:large subunit ribosomal protein L4|nr:MAG: 50S ribosomal protein L4 [Verrucomicrobiota bacterium]MSU04317.1 50S ribosomal protein L4 [Pedosphaera sp.]
MKLPVKDIKGNAKGELEVNLPLIEDGRGTQAVHDTVVAYMAAQRSGTACTKTMGDVNGTGKKPWKQKGTGRARAGSFASPLWRGGGVVFGPKPRSYRKKVSKSTRHLSLRKALTERLKSNDIMIVDEIKFETPKTKGFQLFLAAQNITGTVLVISQGTDKNLTLSARNVPGVELTTSKDLNTYQVLRYDKMIVTQGALQDLQDRLNKE